MTRAPAALLLALAAHAALATPITVGSKKFTESVLLGAVAAHLLTAAGFDVRQRKQLGGTRVLWEALRRGDIDVYPEYTGTIREELFAHQALHKPGALRAALAAKDIAMSAPLGFANNYALAMRTRQAKKLGISDISGLRAHPRLAFGFSNEFMDRADGWPGLRRAYRLPQANVRGLDHDLAYRALATGAVDVTDVYTTDPEIAYYHLRVLRDNRGYFRDYPAVWLYRANLPAAAKRALARLSGKLNAAQMRNLNARVKLQREPAGQVAADYLKQSLGLAGPRAQKPGRVRLLLRYTGEHLFLVLVSLGAAIVLALPLGLWAAVTPAIRQPVLVLVSVLQTIPSLALLVILVPLLGIGALPAIVALFVYSLLPIVRNTVTGITGIPAGLRESAEALGLPLTARLRRVYLPLAMPSVLAGIKIAAVINVGTATLAALIGAGGYGQPILTGIRLDDPGLILLGAVPAALMALAVQGLFDLAERHLLPRGLRTE